MLASPTSAPQGAGVSSAAEVRGWVEGLRDREVPLDAAQCVDLLRALEELRCAAEGAQAAAAVRLDAAMRTHDAEAGVPAARQGRGVASQVALARRESPHRGSRHLGLAKVLASELPHTYRLLRAGRIGEWRATLIARESAHVNLEQRLEIDRHLCATTPGGEPLAVTLGERTLGARARGLADRLDPAAALRRRRHAEDDRHVSLRPAPDAMCWLGALLPVAEGVATLVSLTTHADQARAGGDPRSKGQVMADALVDRVCRPTTAEAETSTSSQVTWADCDTTELGTEPWTDGGAGEERPVAGGLGLRVNLTVSDTILFGTGTGPEAETPGWLDGIGEIPAELARELVRAATLGHLSSGQRAQHTELRRLYTDPDGRVVALDSRARLFPTALAELIRLRDQTCRTPWCEAPIRHIDHIQPAADDGPTTLTNGQGLCEACNHAKQAAAWQQTYDKITAQVITRTPTGHTYRSGAPPAPPPTDPRPRIDLHYPGPRAA